MARPEKKPNLANYSVKGDSRIHLSLHGWIKQVNISFHNRLKQIMLRKANRENESDLMSDHQCLLLHI